MFIFLIAVTRNVYQIVLTFEIVSTATQRWRFVFQSTGTSVSSNTPTDRHTVSCDPESFDSEPASSSLPLPDHIAETQRLMPDALDTVQGNCMKSIIGVCLFVIWKDGEALKLPLPF